MHLEKYRFNVGHNELKVHKKNRLSKLRIQKAEWGKTAFKRVFP